jgi:hypothetical protein
VLITPSAWGSQLTGYNHHHQLHASHQALSFILSWYKGIDLAQLEHLRKDGLNDIDPAKLRRRACAIAECTNIDKLFDAGEGEGDKVAGDAELETSGFTESSEETPEDIADGSVQPSPDDTGFVLAARTADGPLPKLADAP